MIKPRAQECPACGHDRIARRPLPPAREPASAGAVDWTCGLCSYTWSQPLPSRPERRWEIG